MYYAFCLVVGWSCMMYVVFLTFPNWLAWPIFAGNVLIMTGIHPDEAWESYNYTTKDSE